MYEHNALGYWLGLALCLTKVRSSRARCPATALIFQWIFFILAGNKYNYNTSDGFEFQLDSTSDSGVSCP